MTLCQLLPSSQTGRSPAPTLPWGQWASLRYTSFAGGRGSCGFQEHSVSCEWFCVPCLRYLVCNFHQLLQVLLHTSCVIYFLQLHFRGHFRTSDVSILRLHSSTSLFYAYTHLWVYSGLYSARRLKMSLFYAYTHLWTYSGLHSARRL